MGGTRVYDRGFTLLELLVAITILAVVAVLSWRGLASLTSTRDRLEPRAEQIHALMATFGQLRTDLDHMPGNPYLFAIPGQVLRLPVVDGGRCLQILRMAAPSDGNPGNAVETVLYCLRNGALVREQSPALRFYSAAPLTSAQRDDMLHDVAQVQWRVWRAGVGWIEAQSDADTASASGLELRLSDTAGRTVRTVFVIGN
jgi:general secretion pathway protein J